MISIGEENSQLGLNYLVASLVIEELYRHGVLEFVISPGARSAPLAFAAYNHSHVNTTVILDERSAAFYALGISKFNRRPSALICTSGSAGAHYLPAIIEACLSEVPLIIITADRPYELHHTGSNQTVEQEGLFGQFVACVRTIYPVASIDELIIALLTTNAVCQVAGATQPVHLNIQFRTPLVVIEPKNYVLPARIQQWLESEVALCEILKNQEVAHLDQKIINLLNQARRGLVIAGSIDNPLDQQALCRFVEEIKWPCVIERAAGVTASYPHVLPVLPQDLESKELLSADLIIHFGKLPTNSSTLSYLTSQSCPCIQVGSLTQRYDSSGFVSHKVLGAPREIAPLLVPYLTQSDLLLEVEKLRSSHEAAILAVSTHDSFTEMQVLNTTLDKLPPEATLYVGNSLPIRLINMAMPTKSNVIVGAHRGASGIDGTLAITAGWVRASRLPVVLLVGDLTFIHDHASLGLFRNMKTSCTIVVINNGGGRIFDTLPTLNELANFEALFLTPQAISIGGIASLYEVPYTCVNSVNSLSEALDRSYLVDNVCIIEANVEGKVTPQLIRQFYSEFSQKSAF